MNAELQKSMQVTGMVGGLDGYMLMILGIMITAGILGGVANYFLSDRQGELSSRDGFKYATLGVIAALNHPRPIRHPSCRTGRRPATLPRRRP